MSVLDFLYLVNKEMSDPQKVMDSGYSFVHSSVDGGKHHRDVTGKMHRKEGPAVIQRDGTKEWWFHGKRHREDGPAIEFANGNKEWFVNNDYHRVGGPSIVKSDGDKYWHQYGLLHREDGPAVEFANGGESWYFRGRLHREDGPAVTNVVSGVRVRQWWWHGESVTKAAVGWRLKERELWRNPPKLGAELTSLTEQYGRPHSYDGQPARVWKDGSQEWFLNGERHRIDGPAVILSTGEEYYYLFNNLLTKEGHVARLGNNTKATVESIKQNIVSTDPEVIAKALESKATNTSSEEKQTEKKSEENKFISWPEDPSEFVQYDSIYTPFKAILEKGYKLTRVNEWTFNYKGYDFGKSEKKILPSLKEQLTEKFLRKEKEKKVSLMDVVMRAMFLMGIEQGRRMAYIDQETIRNLEKTLAGYRERNKNTRYQLARALAINTIKDNNPNLSKPELDKLIQVELEKTRHARLEEIRKEIQMDPTLNCFKMKVKKKAKLTDLLGLANTLDPEVVKQNDWNMILKESGCSQTEWKIFCKKHQSTKFIG